MGENFVAKIADFGLSRGQEVYVKKTMVWPALQIHIHVSRQSQPRGTGLDSPAFRWVCTFMVSSALDWFSSFLLGVFHRGACL